jgi:hypothetical protein
LPGAGGHDSTRCVKLRGHSVNGRGRAPTRALRRTSDLLRPASAVEGRAKLFDMRLVPSMFPFAQRRFPHVSARAVVEKAVTHVRETLRPRASGPQSVQRSRRNTAGHRLCPQHHLLRRAAVMREASCPPTWRRLPASRTSSAAAQEPRRAVATRISLAHLAPRRVGSSRSPSTQHERLRRVSSVRSALLED